VGGGKDRVIGAEFHALSCFYCGAKAGGSEFFKAWTFSFYLWLF
jgi:hypothetical protein